MVSLYNSDTYFYDMNKMYFYIAHKWSPEYIVNQVKKIRKKVVNLYLLKKRVAIVFFIIIK